jgi:DNA-binding NtrC family response regulator
MTGHGDMETAINTMRLGAFDYISKPPDLNRLLNTVRNALDKKNNSLRIKFWRKKSVKNYEMIGKVKYQSHQSDDWESSTNRSHNHGSQRNWKELVAHQLHEKRTR